MSVVLWLIVLVPLLVVLIYRHLTRNFNYWKDRGVPFLKPVVLFGNMFKAVTFKQSLGQLTRDVYDHVDSRMTGFFIFDQPFLVVRDLELVKRVLVKDFEYFENRTLAVDPEIDEFGARILFTMQNPKWKQVRAKLTPALTPGKLRGMRLLMIEVDVDLASYIDDAISNARGLIDSREMSMKYTTDVISSCAFGINAQCLRHEGAEFRVAARRFFAFNFTRATQFASYYLAPSFAKMFKFKLMEPESARFMTSVFWKHMQQRKESKTKRGDLIDILLQLKEESSGILDGEILVAQALQFFLAGFETTGSTITFALYELALNSTVQKRLREEIKATLDKHGEISYETVMNMKYLDNIISETLRKYPPLTFLDRRCNKTYQIPDSNVTIQEGIPIYISLLGLHMDSAYFPEPDKFDPDRFSDENKDSIVPFTYMPFGEGPRNCIGIRFGLLSAKLALVAIIGDFEVCPDTSTPIPMRFDPRAGVLVAPEGAMLNLRYKRCS